MAVAESSAADVAADDTCLEVCPCGAEGMQKNLKHAVSPAVHLPVCD